MSEHQRPESSETEEPTETAETGDEGGTSDTERTLIRQGRDFEEEYRLSAAEVGEFLVALGEGLQEGEELTVETDEWELPFAFGEPVGLEVDYEGVGEPELEIEVEIPGKTDEDAPNVR
ncbi:MAG: amphi-Trp domain-containing protein [Halobaculum sp.]